MQLPGTRFRLTRAARSGAKNSLSLEALAVSKALASVGCLRNMNKWDSRGCSILAEEVGSGVPGLFSFSPVSELRESHCIAPLTASLSTKAMSVKKSAKIAAAFQQDGHGRTINQFATSSREQDSGGSSCHSLRTRPTSH